MGHASQPGGHSVERPQRVHPNRFTIIMKFLQNLTNYYDVVAVGELWRWRRGDAGALGYSQPAWRGAAAKAQGSDIGTLQCQNLESNIF